MSIVSLDVLNQLFGRYGNLKLFSTLNKATTCYRYLLPCAVSCITTIQTWSKQIISFLNRPPHRSTLRSLTNILHFPFVNACSLSFILLHTSGLEQHRVASVPDSKNHPTIPRHRPRVVLCAIKNWNVVFPPLETFPRCCKGQFSLST